MDQMAAHGHFQVQAPTRPGAGLAACASIELFRPSGLNVHLTSFQGIQRYCRIRRSSKEYTEYEIKFDFQILVVPVCLVSCNGYLAVVGARYELGFA